MFYVLALGSAALYGAADFLGGLTSRRANTVAIVAISQFAGMIVLALMLAALPATSPTARDWLWGAAAGFTGGVGVAFLYQALAVGTMAIVAPITAVCAVAIPVLVAFTLGERPGAFALAGIGLAVVAIVLVSQQAASEDPNRRASSKPATSAVGLALASGVGIGFFFVSLSRAGADAGLWPVLSARLVSTALFSALIIFRRQSIRMPPPVAWTAIACGVVDMLANLLYLVATRSGPLSVVVTLSSLYPASTVLLARLVLGERLSWRQTTGIVCAMAAVLLIVGSR